MKTVLYPNRMAGASTTPANVDSSIREVWAQRVLREHLVAGFWKNLIGPEGSGMPIIQKTELLDKPGDLIHINTTAPLTGSGVEGDTTQLEGSEENLTTSQIQVQPEFYRHAVRWYRRANKKSLLDLREEARMRLREWGGEKMDDIRFAQFTSTNAADVVDATYTANEHLVAGRANVDAIVAGDTLTVEEIQRIKLKLVNQKAKPIRTAEGLPVYGMVIHPNCAFGLKREAEYRDWVKDAQVRGDSNPMFKGALAMIDGVVLFEHPNVPVATNANATPTDVATCVAFGREAFVEGVDENPSWAEDTFDYENEFGIAYSFAFQPRRALPLASALVYVEAEPVA